MMSDSRLYLDHNATSPMRPETIKTMTECMAHPYNASSIHHFGQHARHIVETAREHIAALAHVTPGQVIFNSGATEGNNTVLAHFAKEGIAISATEHPSVYEAAPNAKIIPVHPNGLLDLNALEDILKTHKPGLVSVMAVNNESGVIQPLQDIAALCKRYGAFLHSDAVQAAGRIDLNMAALGIDFLTLSAHKIGGPQGVGALILGFCGETPILLHGGGQERSARAGTENVAGIAGFGAAAHQAQNFAAQNERLKTYQERIETELQSTAADLIIFGQNAPRAPNTTLFALPNITSERMLMSFDLEGIAISNGSACSSGSIKPSRVVTAMGYDDALATCALRLSTGWNTSENDIDRFLEVWHKIYNRVKI